LSLKIIRLPLRQAAAELGNDRARAAPDSKCANGGSPWFHCEFDITIVGLIGFGWWMNPVPTRPDRFVYRSVCVDIVM
jgi:hypothetical protein